MKHPPDIHWTTEPIPSAQLCHADTRIIIWKWFAEEEYVRILQPYTGGKGWYANYWHDEKSRMWSPEQLKGIEWAWWRSFHPVVPSLADYETS